MKRLLTLSLLAAACVAGQEYHAEGFPDEIVARLENRDRLLRDLPPAPFGFSPQFVIETLKRWQPGSTIRVAFLGATTCSGRTWPTQPRHG